MDHPDSSQVVENPDFEFDEFVEERESPSRMDLKPAPDELTASELRDMSLFMYNNLQHQPSLYLAFRNALTFMTSGISFFVSSHF
jgi:hypothetical protein